ncbi:hypothetical protein JCM9957A_49060 [Kineosporia succinea]
MWLLSDTAFDAARFTDGSTAAGVVVFSLCVAGVLRSAGLPVFFEEIGPEGRAVEAGSRAGSEVVFRAGPFVVRPVADGLGETSGGFEGGTAATVGPIPVSSEKSGVGSS